MNWTKCPICNGKIKKQDKEAIHPVYKIKRPLYLCNSCKENIFEWDLNEKDLLIDLYVPHSMQVDFINNSKNLMLAKSELLGFALDFMQEDSMNFIFSILETIESEGEYFLNKYLLDFYDFKIDDFIKNINWFSNFKVSYKVVNTESNLFILKKLEDFDTEFKEMVLYKELEEKIVKCHYTGVNSAINWYGGKYFMRKDLISIFPKHHTYVSVCGGAAHDLIGKSPSPIEVYNDINSGLYDFFKILRNPELTKKLKFQLQHTPYSKKEFDEAKNWKNEKDLIERVRKFYIRTMQSVNCNGGWSKSKNNDTANNMAARVSRWIGNIDVNIDKTSKRMRRVQVENRDLLRIIDIYDSLHTLFYIDPPYILSTRVDTNGYDHEMTDEQHIALVDKLIKVKGKVVLSGYDHKIYNRLLKYGFKKQPLGEYTKHSSKERTIAEEFVWINFEIENENSRENQLSFL